MHPTPAFALLIATSSLMAVEISADKSGYSLFNPTPAGYMRDLSTDRPDTTESPYSVDAGHFQFEFEALSLGRDHSDEGITTTISSSVNAKVGLTNRSDLQLVMEYYRSESLAGDDGTSRASGLGDMDIRYKFNLWGNDGGMTAAAVMPFVTLPSHNHAFGSDRYITGGLILPLAISLENGWDLGVMMEFDLARNAANDGYAGSVVQSITAAHDIYEELGGFMEFVNVAHAEASTGGEAYWNGGLTYGIGKNVQLDAGFNLGLTEASEDTRLFVGASVRL